MKEKDIVSSTNSPSAKKMKREKSGRLMLYEKICFAVNNKFAGEHLAMKKKTKPKLHHYFFESA